MIAAILLLFTQTLEDLAGPERAEVVIGEVTATTALLQARAIDPASTTSLFVGVQGLDDSGAELDEVHLLGAFKISARSPRILRIPLSGLLPDTTYAWSVHRSEDGTIDFSQSISGTFRTLAGSEKSRALSFVVTNCMNHHYFMHGGQGRPAYQGEDKHLGYPGLAAIHDRKPSFVVFAGDNVYYDRPRDNMAKDAESMRAHWHQLFALPRMRTLLQSTSTYWLKDDHDHRFNDSDTTGDKAPNHALGRKIFREQVPIVPQDDDEAPTWRTIRVSKDLQIWMTEGRDHRSPNKMEPGPEKTMWGIEQRDWLKRTLLESDAAFKILVSPTPMVGPDDGYKADNHTNPKGFAVEGIAFHEWLAEHKLNDQGFLIICGDRHWQYHSIHPQGTHEFAVGALLDSNARMGRKPGDAKSTDPYATIKQPYTSKKPSGGFLEVQLVTEPELHLELIFRDEHGVELYRTRRNP